MLQVREREEIKSHCCWKWDLRHYSVTLELQCSHDIQIIQKQQQKDATTKNSYNIKTENLRNISSLNCDTSFWYTPWTLGKYGT